jgi:hypothetical protein
LVDIEKELNALEAVIDWPEVDLVHGVRARLDIGQRAPKRFPRWAVAMAIVAAVVAAIVATPAGRQAVADLFGVAGISITWGDSAEPVGTEFALGEPVPLAEAAAGVESDLLVPEDAPDAVYLGDVPSGGAVHMVWRAGESLPASAGTEVGILYSQFAVTGSELFIKSLESSDTVERVEVRGSLGFWVEGPHEIIYQDLDGVMHEELARLSGNVLAWEKGGVTHRIETMQSLAEALALAESLQPAT